MVEKLTQETTFEKIFDLAMKYIDDPVRSKEFYLEYFRMIKEAEPLMSDAAVNARISDNLGYYAGYYDVETRKKVREVYGAVHPIFGDRYEDLTPEEIRRLAEEHAKKIKR
jgi:hypothetical protein